MATSATSQPKPVLNQLHFGAALELVLLCYLSAPGAAAGSLVSVRKRTIQTQNLKKNLPNNRSYIHPEAGPESGNREVKSGAKGA